MSYDVSVNLNLNTEKFNADLTKAQETAKEKLSAVKIPLSIDTSPAAIEKLNTETAKIKLEPIGVKIIPQKIKQSDLQKAIRGDGGERAVISVPLSLKKATATSLKKAINSTQEMAANKGYRVDVGLGVKRINAGEKFGVKSAVSETQRIVDSQSENAQYKVHVGTGLRPVSPQQVNTFLENLQGQLNTREVVVRVGAVPSGAVTSRAGSVAAKEAAVVAGGAMSLGGMNVGNENDPQFLAKVKRERDRLRDFADRQRVITTAQSQMPETVQNLNAQKSNQTLLNYSGMTAAMASNTDGVKQLQRLKLSQSAIIADAKIAAATEREMDAVNRPIIQYQKLQAESRDRVKRELGLIKEAQAIKKTDYVTMGHQMTRAGNQALYAIGLPTALLGGAAVHEYMGFDKQIGMIGSLTNTKPGDLSQIRGGLNDMALSGQSIFSPTELGEGYQQIAHFSNDVADNMKVLATTTKAASTGLGSLDSISDVVTSALNAYGGKAKDATRYTDIILRMTQEGKGKVQQYGPALGRVMPIASSLGVSLEQVAANITMGTRIGMTPQESANGLRRILTTLITPSKQANDVMAKMGTNPQELLKDLQTKGLASVLNEVMKKSGGNMEAVGTMFGSIRALTQVLAAAGKQGDDYIKVLNDIEHAQGITTRAQAEAAKTLDYSFKQATSQIKAASNAMMEHLAPSLIKVAEWAGKAIPAGIEHATTLAQLHPFATKAAGVGALATAALPLGLTIAGSALQGAAELGKIGVNMKGIFLPALGLAGAALGAYTVATDSATSKMTGIASTLVSIAMMIPAAHQGIGMGARMLFGNGLSGDERTIGLIGRAKGVFSGIKPRLEDTYLAYRMASMPRYLGAANPIAKGGGVFAGLNAGTAALTSGIGMTGLLAVPLAAGAGLMGATYLQNQKAAVLDAETQQYNKKIVTDKVSASFGALGDGIGDNLSGKAQTDVSSRVEAIKEAFNKAVAEGSDAMIESTTRQLEKLMSDVQLRTDISNHSKTIIEGYLAQTFDKVYQLNVKVNGGSSPADFEPNSPVSKVALNTGLAGDFLAYLTGADLDPKYAAIKQKMIQIKSSDTLLGRIWKGDSDYYQEAVQQLASEQNKRNTDAALIENRKRAGRTESGIIGRIGGNANQRQDRVPKLTLKQTNQAINELLSQMEINKLAGKTIPNRGDTDLLERLRSHKAQLTPAKNAGTPLDYRRFDGSTGGGTGSVVVPQPRMSAISGNIDALMNGMMNVGSKSDETAMKLELLKAAAEGLSDATKGAALQIARYSDQMKHQEALRSITGSVLNKTYGEYLSKGIIPGQNNAVAAMEKLLHVGDTERSIMSKAGQVRANASFMIYGNGQGREFAGQGSETTSPIGAKIAETAIRALDDSTFTSVRGCCQRFVRQVLKAAGEEVGKLSFGTATAAGKYLLQKGIAKKGVAVKDLKAGDALYKIGANHVGVYVGNGMVAENTSSSRGDHHQGAKALTPIGKFGRYDAVARFGGWSGGDTTSSNPVKMTRQQKADAKAARLMAAEAGKILEMTPGTYDNALSLYNSKDAAMLKRKFGSTADIQAHPEAHQGELNLMNIVFGSKENVKELSKMGDKAFGTLMAFLRNFIRNSERDLNGRDAAKSFKDQLHALSMGTDKAAGLSSLYSGAILSGDYSGNSAFFANEQAKKDYIAEQTDPTNLNTDYNKLRLSPTAAATPALRKARADAELKKHTAAMDEQFKTTQSGTANANLFGIGKSSDNAVSVAKANLAALQAATSPEMAELNAAMAKAEQEARNAGEGGDPAIIEAAIKKARKDAESIFKLSQATAFATNILSAQETTRDAKARHEGFSKGLRGGNLDIYAAADAATRNGAGKGGVILQESVATEKAKAEFQNYLDSLNESQGTQMDALISQYTTTKKYGIGSNARVKQAGEEAVAAERLKAIELGVTLENEKQIRAGAEQLEQQRQKNQMLSDELTTQEQITLDAKKRASDRAINGMGLPSDIAGAAKSYQDVVRQANAAYGNGDISAAGRDLRVGGAADSYKDTLKNYINDKAMSVYGSNADSMLGLYQQQAEANLGGSTDPVKRTEAMITAYDKYAATLKGVAPISDDLTSRLMAQAKVMQTLQDSTDATTKKWTEFHSTVDAVNQAIVIGLNSWKDGIRSFADYVKNIAFEDIAKKITNKIFGLDQVLPTLVTGKPSADKTNDLTGVGALALNLFRMPGAKTANVGPALPGGDGLTGLGSLKFPSLQFPASGAGGVVSAMAGIAGVTGAGGPLNASTVVVNGNVVNVNGGGMGAATAGTSPVSQAQAIGGFIGLVLGGGGGATTTAAATGGGAIWV